MNFPKIPSQVKGDFQDVVSMYCGDSIEVAMQKFKTVYTLFLSVNTWHDLSDDVKPEFYLLESETYQITTELRIGNFIKLDIPGPGSPSGRGFDWTKIIGIEDEMHQEELPFFAFTVCPCADPESNNQHTAHFYTETSSNTFIIRRIGHCIYAEVHGRNEENNTTEVPLMDTLRNKAITVGSKIGLGGLNWQAFTKALVATVED